MSRTVKAETSKTPIEDLHHSWYLKILSCCIRLSYILLQQKPFCGYLFPFWNINVNISRIYSFCWRLTHIYVEFYNNAKLEKGQFFVIETQIVVQRPIGLRLNLSEDKLRLLLVLVLIYFSANIFYNRRLNSFSSELRLAKMWLVTLSLGVFCMLIRSFLVYF